MDAPFTFDSNNQMDDFFNFDAFPEPEWDLGGADLSAESALASPFAPSCMQGGDEAAFRPTSPGYRGAFNFGGATDILAVPFEAYDNINGHALGTMTNQDSASGSSDIRTAPVAYNRLIYTAVASGSENLGVRGKSSIELCSCPKCAISRGAHFYRGGNRWCTCGYKYKSHYRDIADHYKTHFEDEQGRYRCHAPNCDTTFARWGELTRHYRTHCLKPETFPCDVIGCKYGGENGFTRKDKLSDHRRKVHDGKATPDQLMRMQKRKLAPKD